MLDKETSYVYNMELNLASKTAGVCYTVDRAPKTLSESTRSSGAACLGEMN